MKVVELSPEKIADVKRVMLEIFTREPWNDTWTDRQLEQYLRELMGNANSLAFGLYDGETLIGISLGRVIHWYEGTEYWIDELGLIPERQRQGYGAGFLARIEDCLLKREIAYIVLLTEKSVPAYHFYLKNGFLDKPEQAFFVKSVGAPNRKRP